MLIISTITESEITLINGDEDKCSQYAELFNCQIGGFPIKYLGDLLVLGGSMSRTGCRWWRKMKKSLKSGRVASYP